MLLTLLHLTQDLDMGAEKIYHKSMVFDHTFLTSDSQFGTIERDTLQQQHTHLTQDYEY
jgi:hypothetical protein